MTLIVRYPKFVTFLSRDRPAGATRCDKYIWIPRGSGGPQRPLRPSLPPSTRTPGLEPSTPRTAHRRVPMPIPHRRHPVQPRPLNARSISGPPKPVATVHLLHKCPASAHLRAPRPCVPIPQMQTLRVVTASVAAPARQASATPGYARGACAQFARNLNPRVSRSTHTTTNMMLRSL